MSILSISIVFLALFLFFAGCRGKSNYLRTSQEEVKWIIRAADWELDLSENQKEELKKLAHRWLSVSTVDHDDFKQQLLAEFEKDTINTDTLDLLWKKKLFSLNKVKEIHMGYLLELHTLLNPEQRRKLVKIIRKHDQHGFTKYFSGGK